MASGLVSGFLLDAQWHWLRGEMDQTKKPALLTICRILADERVPYAIIGGLAVQIHHPDPRTTLDIDLAVLTRESIPARALEAAGFQFTGSFEHSQNWLAPDGTPVQFSDDTALANAVKVADEMELEGARLRVIRVEDLLHEKIRAAEDPARRRSKRLMDLADVEALLEATPKLANSLTAEERSFLQRFP
jgi:hypothetical protein